MPKPLRSNFEPGSPREAVRRAQWKALGLTDADMLKPKIAVVNSSSELAICFSHLDGIAKVVKEAVREAGGLPFEIRTAAPSDFIISAGARRRLHAGQPRPDRQRHGDCRRGRAARRHDLPVVVRQDAARASDGGRPLQHPHHPRHLRLSAERALSRQARGHRRRVHRLGAGDVRQALARKRCAGMCDHAITGPGVCAGMGTANSMHIVCEALGMTLPGARAGAGQQPEDVRPRPRIGTAHRGDGVGGPQAARHPDAGRVSQRRRRRAGGQRLDQLRQASAGDRRRSRRRRRSSSRSSTSSASRSRC